MGLCRRVLGADDASFGAIIGKGGTRPGGWRCGQEVAALPPAGRLQWPRRPLRHQAAAPALAGSGRGHHRGCGGRPAGRARGRESIDSLWSIGKSNDLFHRPRPPTPCHSTPAGARAWRRPAPLAPPTLASTPPGRARGAPRHRAPPRTAGHGQDGWLGTGCGAAWRGLIQTR